MVIEKSEGMHLCGLAMPSINNLQLKIVSSLYVLLVYNVFGAPTQTQRWRQPCVGSTNASGQPLVNTSTRVREADARVAYKLYMEASDLQDVAQNLLRKYTESRIESPDLQAVLDRNTIVPGFPDNRTMDSQVQFFDRMLEDYRRASIAAVFIEELKADERRSRIEPNYIADYRTLESHIYPLLCQLQMAIQDRKAPEYTIPYVTRDVMHTSVRQATTIAESHIRDYKILKNIVMLFESIKADYNILRTQLVTVVATS